MERVITILDKWDSSFSTVYQFSRVDAEIHSDGQFFFNGLPRLDPVSAGDTCRYRNKSEFSEFPVDVTRRIIIIRARWRRHCVATI
jgi:hypothetical protein